MPLHKTELTVSSNGRYLQHEDGTPFFYLADTAWELFHRLTGDEATRYLSDRASKGFTVIQAVILAELGGLEAGGCGEQPFTDNNPRKPNEAYFRHVDRIVDTAEQYGLFMAMLPTWGCHWKTTKENPSFFTSESIAAYGRFLGGRYAQKPVIWVLGGDRNIDGPEERCLMDTLAAALREGDGGRHLITYHPSGPGQSSRNLPDAPWLDIRMNQTSHGARDHDNGLFAERDYACMPARPVIDGEPRYEAIPVGFYLNNRDPFDRFDDYDVRQAAYWSVLAGACGHTYGNNNIWQMWIPGRNPVIWANTPWHEALNHPGAFQMGHLRRLFESRRFHKLVPDGSIVVDGPRTGGGKVRAAVADDGSVAIVYIPRGDSVTLDKGRIRARRVKELWFDPRYGRMYHILTHDNQGFQTYTPPSRGRGNDWVLVLEDEAAGFAAL